MIADNRPSIRPAAVLFDAYGTLFDVYSVARAAESHFPGHGDALAALWRDKQIDYTRLSSMGRRYRPFSELTRLGLRNACARLALPLTTAIEDHLIAAYAVLAPHPDALPTLQALRALGVRCGILSNADPDMLAQVVRHAGLTGLLGPLLSVDETRCFKTDPACYALGPRYLGLPADRILFVSSNGWDAIGATWFGYTTLWVNRSGQPLEHLDTEPTRRGRSLNDVLRFFDADAIADVVADPGD
jgi:2-haloacid dehalogenase